MVRRTQDRDDQPRRRPRRPRRVDAGADGARRQRPHPDPAVPRRAPDRRLRHGLLLGGRAHVLADPGRLLDGRRLRGWLHPEPDLRGGVLGAHRPHRGRARRVRPEGHQLRAAPEGVLGGSRPDPGHAPGQRRRYPVPVGHLRRPTPTSGPRPRRRATPSRRASTPPGTARSRRRSPTSTPSTTPRTTTSSTCRRCPTATAASAAPACPARWAWPAPTDTQSWCAAHGQRLRRLHRPWEPFACSSP